MKTKQYTFNAPTGEVSFIGPMNLDGVPVALINRKLVTLSWSFNEWSYKAGDISARVKMSGVTGSHSLFWGDLPARKPDPTSWKWSPADLKTFELGGDNELCSAAKTSRVILATGRELPQRLQKEVGSFRTPDFDALCKRLAMNAQGAAGCAFVGAMGLSFAASQGTSFPQWILPLAWIFVILLAAAAISFYTRSGTRHSAYLLITVAVLDLIARLAALSVQPGAVIFILIGAFLDISIIINATKVLELLKGAPGNEANDSTPPAT